MYVISMQVLNGKFLKYLGNIILAILSKKKKLKLINIFWDDTNKDNGISITQEEKSPKRYL